VEVTRRLDADPVRSVAVEDSTNGIRAAMAAGKRMVVVPRPFNPASTF
jgi:beta-phosphoglucomutase-like phosphatase (HAD superfamily)